MSNLVRRNRFLDPDFFNHGFDAPLPRLWQTTMHQPVQLDLTEDDDKYIVTASVPGIKANDIEVNLTGNQLEIKGEVKADNKMTDDRYYVRERQYGRFIRSVTLPGKVREDNIEATVHNGILTVHLPKVTARQSRRIRIKRNQEGGYHGIVEKIKKVLPRPKLPKLTKSS